MFVRGKHSAFQDSPTSNTFESAANVHNASEFGMVILESRAWHCSPLSVRRFFVGEVEALRAIAHCQREKMV